MTHYDAHSRALKSFKEHFPQYSNEEAEKLMDAFIQVKRKESTK